MTGRASARRSSRVRTRNGRRRRAARPSPGISLCMIVRNEEEFPRRRARVAARRASTRSVSSTPAQPTARSPSPSRSAPASTRLNLARRFRLGSQRGVRDGPPCLDLSCSMPTKNCSRNRSPALAGLRRTPGRIERAVDSLPESLGRIPLAAKVRRRMRSSASFPNDRSGCGTAGQDSRIRCVAGRRPRRRDHDADRDRASWIPRRGARRAREARAKSADQRSRVRTPIPTDPANVYNYATSLHARGESDRGPCGCSNGPVK